MELKVINIGDALVECHDDGQTITRLAAGTVLAYPEDTQEYRDRARDLGYGDDVSGMSRDHEITHSLLAKWLGLPASPALSLAAAGKESKNILTGAEEAAVLAIQRFAKMTNASILQIAEDCEKENVL